MPKISATNLKDNPMKYFYSILYDYGNSDRFSWIDSSATNLTNQLNGINTVLGIKYSIFIPIIHKPILLLSLPMF